MLLDAPDRVASATMFCTTALGGYGSPELPPPSAELLALWEHLADPGDADAELDRRVAHWRLRGGTGTPFDDEGFRSLEERIVEHAGRHDSPVAHARAAQTGPDRGAELAAVDVPALVNEAPEDPIDPPRTPGTWSARSAAAPWCASPAWDMPSTAPWCSRLLHEPGCGCRQPLRLPRGHPGPRAGDGVDVPLPGPVEPGQPPPHPRHALHVLGQHAGV